jgi:hypothetical protein
MVRQERGSTRLGSLHLTLNKRKDFSGRQLLAETRGVNLLRGVQKKSSKAIRGEAGCESIPKDALCVSLSTHLEQTQLQTRSSSSTASLSTHLGSKSVLRTRSSSSTASQTHLSSTKIPVAPAALLPRPANRFTTCAY